MKRVEKRKGKNQKDGGGRGETKELRREDYIQAEKGRKGKKEQEVSESIRTELTQDLIPSQEIPYQLKEQEVSEPV